jgi:hypothetical protein
MQSDCDYLMSIIIYPFYTLGFLYVDETVLRSCMNSAWSLGPNVDLYQ